MATKKPSTSYRDWFNGIIEDLLENPFVGEKSPTEPAFNLTDNEDEFEAMVEQVQQGKQRAAVAIVDYEYSYPNHSNEAPFVSYLIKVIYNMRKCTKLSDNQEPLVVESKITEADVAQDYIIKRFSQFHELHTQIRKEYRGSIPDMAPRTFLGDALSADVIKKRKSKLQRYLNSLLYHDRFYCKAVAKFLGLTDVEVDSTDPRQQDRPTVEENIDIPVNTNNAQPCIHLSEIPLVKSLTDAQKRLQEQVEENIFEL